MKGNNVQERKKKRDVPRDAPPRMASDTSNGGRDGGRGGDVCLQGLRAHDLQSQSAR